MAMTLTSVQRIGLIGGRGLHIPPEGWNAHNFSVYGARMISAMARTAKIEQSRLVPEVARRSLNLFQSQIQRVGRRAQESEQHHRLGFRAAGQVTFSLPQSEELWREAIDFVFNLAGIEIVTALVPPIQSAMAQGYSKTSYFLAQPTDQAINTEIARQVRDVAKLVVQINDTTRDNILNAVRAALKENMTVVQTAAYIQKKTSAIFGTRAMTVARTELNRAWTQGAAMAYQGSDAITQVSVIGCEAREENSPQYNDESTCNYQDLPIEELDAFLEVGFHPNHTGTLVPSGFKSDEGNPVTE